MKQCAPPETDSGGDRAQRRSLIIGFVLISAFLCLVNLPNILTLNFQDPDDAMRLLEVRDLVAGQSWWDVSQHRLGGGVPFVMHWSRLVDAPIALFIQVLGPVFGAHAATVIAVTLVPMLTLFCVLAIIVRITGQLSDAWASRAAMLLVAVTAPVSSQLQPVRIDHHGWQIVLALAAVAALISRTGAKSGALAGLSLAALIIISIEGLPFAGAVVAVAAIGWALDPRRRMQAAVLVSSFALATLGLQIATRGPAFWHPACDAVSPGWIAALGCSALGFLGIAWLPLRNRWFRLAALVVPGAIGIGVIVATLPDCLRGGPFNMLDPFLRQWWYDKIPEGLPLWRQTPHVIYSTYVLPLLGLAGAMLALKRSDGERRTGWMILIALQLVALAISIMVLRAGGTANALAIPGAAVLGVIGWQRARDISGAPKRIAATLGVILLFAPVLIATSLNLAAPNERAQARAVAHVHDLCTDGRDLQALNQLPPGRLFAPLDIGPDALVRTPHQAVASGYHRNAARMELVMRAFMGSPQAAHRAIIATGANYVVGCPGLQEALIYDQAAPNGFWSRLERGERFSWLQPIKINGSPVLAWRVLPNGGSRP